jgi:serine/threonine protein kinase
VRNAIYIPALARTFEINRIIKKSIYGKVVSGYELYLEEDFSIDPNFPCFRRLPLEVAIKIYEKSRLARPDVAAEKPENELAAMLMLSERWYQQQQAHQLYQEQAYPLMSLIACCADEENLYAVMPFLPSKELFDVVAEGGANRNKAEIQHFLRHMVAAMRHMRHCGVAHRDMSLENTLIVPPSESSALSAPQYVVIDFGMALCMQLFPDSSVGSGQYQVHHSHHHHHHQHQLPSSAEQQQQLLQSLQSRYSVFHPGVCGKRGYIAPEILANAPPSAAILQRNMHIYESQERFYIDLFQCDVWSLGVMLFMLVTGMPPFSVADVSDARFKVIAKGRLGDLLRHWNIALDNEVEDLLLKLLVVDPMQRITIEEVAQHPLLAHSVR